MGRRAGKEERRYSSLRRRGVRDGVNETERFNEFTGLVSRTYKALHRAQEKYMRDFGLRSVHVSCLLRLLDAPEGLSATELSARCGVDRAQISRVTAELEARGLVCETAPGAKRRYRGSLTLTDYGRGQAAEMKEIVAEKLNAVSGSLDQEKLAVFYEVFHQIADKLDGI